MIFMVLEARVTARHRAPRAVRPRRTAAAGSGALSLLLLAAALLVAPLTAEATTGTLVRLAQLSPELQGVELVMSSVADPRRSTMVAALDYGELSAYQAVAPGDLRLTVGAPGEPGVELPVTVAANQVASVVLTAGASGPSARVVVDAGGPAVVPPGPVHAG